MSTSISLHVVLENIPQKIFRTPMSNSNINIGLSWKCLIVNVKLHYGNSHEATKLLPTRAGQFKGSVREFNVFSEVKIVERYLGLPYAETPGRFQRPVLKAPMQTNSVYDATKFRPSCSQIEVPLFGARKPEMMMTETSEDCLFLNIYKPGGETVDGLRAVMVYIHPGGFVTASPQIFSGDYISAYGDVIFITIAYRLAAMGFLSTGEATLPGNLGLWDQHTAFRWIHENIADFGGDPGRVTIIGGSAGSASVIYHSMFPRNKGLFQRAIGMSGSITCPWSFQPNPYQITLRFAERLGCPTQIATEEIVHCIESKSTEEIHSTLNDPVHKYIKFPMEMVTVVDGEFLTANPYKTISVDSELSADAKAQTS